MTGVGVLEASRAVGGYEAKLKPQLGKTRQVTLSLRINHVHQRASGAQAVLTDRAS
jgi:hypothetical protein